MYTYPRIDKRTAQDIFEHVAGKLREELSVDVEGDDPLAEALLRIFSRYSELVIQRLNSAPNKNYIAFMDMLNISRIPPVPAWAPLTFNPVAKIPEARDPIVIPPHTKIASAMGDGNKGPVVFETIQELALTNIELKEIVALDPEMDLYANKSMLIKQEVEEGESVFQGVIPVVHELHIGHKHLLSTPGITRLSLQLEIENGATRQYAGQVLEWQIMAVDGFIMLEPSKDTTAQLTRSGEIVFENLPEWKAKEIFDQENHWLTCRLMIPLRKWLPVSSKSDRTMSSFSRIRNIEIAVDSNVEEIAIQSAFFNHIALDLSKDYFPLGERPRFGDVFYLCCGAFSKPLAQTTLHIKLTNPAAAGVRSPIRATSKKGKPLIQWEFWNGARWNELDCKDNTDALTENGEVIFSVPKSVQATSINGVEGAWVRVRLLGGEYAEEANPEFPFQSIMAPPSIQHITVTSSLASGPRKPDSIVTLNNFEFEQYTQGDTFQPFKTPDDPFPVIYFGFKPPNENNSTLSEGTIDLYFHLDEPSDRAYVRAAMAERLPVMVWQYWNREEWKNAHMVDGTNSLSQSGVMNIRTGDAISKWQKTSLSKGLHWLRLMWTSGDFIHPPKLRRALLNTVPSYQIATIENELLGSSNGKPNQIFQSTRSPILSVLELEVRVTNLPLKTELHRTYQDGEKDILSHAVDSNSNTAHNWVRWKEVDDFLSSKHEDRHFVVHRKSGRIRFGDGQKGLIPTTGTNNIRLRRYQTGGGVEGNKPIGSINKLRSSIPYVASVVNLEPASGGQNIEDWASVCERGPRWLRHRERAVTVEDYEDLAKQASPIIAKAKCYSECDMVKDPSNNTIQPGIVSLVIVPRSEYSRPTPDDNLLRHTRDFLNDHRLPGTGLIVLAPEYVQVTVEAVVVTTSNYTSSVVSRCEQKLTAYFHPITGSVEGNGWEFGQKPHESEIYACLESITGLEYIRSLRIMLKEERSGLLNTGSFLICSGQHNICLKH